MADTSPLLEPGPTSVRYHLKSSTRRAIAEELSGGDFKVVSAQRFQAEEGVFRCRYTVRRPRGKKHLHLIGFENGTVRLVRT